MTDHVMEECQAGKGVWVIVPGRGRAFALLDGTAEKGPKPGIESMSLFGHATGCEFI